MNRILPLVGRRRTAKITEIKELANSLPGQARGTRIGAAKLTEDQVRNIRSDNDYSDARLAEKYGVAKSTIWRILNGETWNHVK